MSTVYLFSKWIKKYFLSKTIKFEHYLKNVLTRASAHFNAFKNVLSTCITKANFSIIKNQSIDLDWKVIDSFLCGTKIVLNVRKILMLLLLLTNIYTGRIPQYIQNYKQYIHCCSGDPVKLKIEIILRNKKDKNS